MREKGEKGKERGKRPMERPGINTTRHFIGRVSLT